ncbi:fatty acyl-AMP ligase [Streptomyces sp. NPDC051976]|uniref:fatty acyl-AMP ligase n=1 Tax=Streptomyces sp. NPDC051976 TaxID=3154947 RepID=UPI0034195CFC
MPPTHASTPDSPPPGGDVPLTAYLRHWAADRGQQRAFSFVDFPQPGSPGRHRSVTWERLHLRALALAGRLAATAGPGDRAALLLPQGLDYVTAFLGCLYARVIAVPLFAPGLPGHAGRLRAVLDDCEPACVLTDSANAAAVEEFTGGYGTAAAPVLCVDRPGTAEESAPVGELPVDPGDIAYLQYTSGSTRTPAGVMISHRNAVANARQALTAFGVDVLPSTHVGWLPLFHDMGLVLSVAAPVVVGRPSVLMDPVSFLEQPLRWLRLLGAYPGTVSAAPNFAYDYCAERISPREVADLRLDRVRVLINGSEPVRPGTVDRFQRAFAPAGLRPEAQCPSYGLAEATVFVAADPYTAPPTVVDCDRAALAAGRVEAAADGALGVRLVACGTPVGQEVRIADPETGTPLPDGQVGEIWLRGPNTGLGYWKQAERTETTFGGRLPGEPRTAPRWLRSGDLGAQHAGQLLVTGRLKDLLIVDGRNHYPQDVEETVQSAVPGIRRDRVAVFTVPGEAALRAGGTRVAGGAGRAGATGAGESAPAFAGRERAAAAAADGAGPPAVDGADPGAGPEWVVAVAEHGRDAVPTAAQREAAVRAARGAVSAEHGLRLARLVLVPPRAVPRTSSGKVARGACRERYLAGEYAEGDGPAAGSGPAEPGRAAEGGHVAEAGDGR